MPVQIISDMTEPKLFPLQRQSCVKHSREAAACPEPVYMAAYEVYRHCYGEQPAMIEGHCRGGFGIEELIAFLYARPFPKAQWSDRVNEALTGLRS